MVCFVTTRDALRSMGVTPQILLRFFVAPAAHRQEPTAIHVRSFGRVYEGQGWPS